MRQTDTYRHAAGGPETWAFKHRNTAERAAGGPVDDKCAAREHARFFATVVKGVTPIVDRILKDFRRG